MILHLIKNIRDQNLPFFHLEQKNAQVREKERQLRETSHDLMYQIGLAKCKQIELLKQNESLTNELKELKGAHILIYHIICEIDNKKLTFISF